MNETVTICEVASCIRPSDGWYVCAHCSVILEQTLSETPWLFDELDIVLTKQTRYTSGNGRGGTERPLPVDLRASAVIDDLRATMNGSARHIAESNNWEVDREASAWLLHRLTAIRLNIAGAQIVDEIMASSTAARYLIDRPANRQYLGDCIDNQGPDCCPGMIYSRSGQTTARCDTCNSEWDATVLRDNLVAKLHDKLCTAAEIAKLSTYLGLSLDRERVRKAINQWHRRGQLVEHIVKGEVRFRFSEAASLLERHAGEKQSA